MKNRRGGFYFSLHGNAYIHWFGEALDYWPLVSMRWNKEGVNFHFLEMPTMVWGGAGSTRFHETKNGMEGPRFF